MDGHLLRELHLNQIYFYKLAEHISKIVLSKLDLNKGTLGCPFFYLEYTTLPSTIVIRTSEDIISSSGTVIKSLEKIVKSANFPTSTLPLISSSKTA